jgi:hypothetical protein
MVTKIDDDRTIAITTFLLWVTHASRKPSYSFGLLQPAVDDPPAGTTVNLFSWQQAANDKAAAGCRSPRGKFTQ